MFTDWQRVKRRVERLFFFVRMQHNAAGYHHWLSLRLCPSGEIKYVDVSQMISGVARIEEGKNKEEGSERRRGRGEYGRKHDLTMDNTLKNIFIYMISGS